MVAELLVKDRNNANLIRYLFTLRPTTVGPRRERQKVYSPQDEQQWWSTSLVRIPLAVGRFVCGSKSLIL